MTIWAIVPVKPLRLGKSRLSEVLTEDERAHFNRTFLERVLGILKEVQEIGQVLVVSRDSEVLAIARHLGAKTVLEDGAQELNMALKRATSVAQGLNARGVLILPADLPLVTAQDIREFIQDINEDSIMRICPDRRESLRCFTRVHDIPSSREDSARWETQSEIRFSISDQARLWFRRQCLPSSPRR